jgi:hypothetical protein
MRTTSLNVGCGLIATAPLFAAHVVFGREIRYILLAWFCSFVSTILLILCSISSLFTTNPWFILLYSIPLDSAGKAVLKYFGCRQHFLRSPRARLSLGLSCGLGFALAHVLTMFLPMCFDQPYSVDFDHEHPAFFPNSLDLALMNNAMSVFQMAVGLLWFRFTRVNIVVMYVGMTGVQLGMAAMSQIPMIMMRLVAVITVSYGLLFIGVMSFRALDGEAVNDEKVGKDHKE